MDKVQEYTDSVLSYSDPRVSDIIFGDIRTAIEGMKR